MRSGSGDRIVEGPAGYEVSGFILTWEGIGEF